MKTVTNRGPGVCWTYEDGVGCCRKPRPKKHTCLMHGALEKFAKLVDKYGRPFPGDVEPVPVTYFFRDGPVRRDDLETSARTDPWETLS